MSRRSPVRRRGTVREFARSLLDGANRLVAPLDALAEKPFKQEPEPLVIVGLPRSGTTLVYQLVVEAFDFAYLTRSFEYVYGLPNLALRAVRPFTRRPATNFSSDYGRTPGRFAPGENHVFWSRWFPERAGFGHYVPAIPRGRPAADEMGRVLGSMTAIAGSQLVFKDVYLTMSTAGLLSALGNARVLFVTRELEAVLASVYARRAALGTGRWWSIRPPLAEEVADDDLARQVAFQCVRSWQVASRQIQSAPQDRLKVVDYADICCDPAGFIDGVAAWLGPTATRRPTARVPERFTPRPPVSLSGEVRRQLDARARDLREDCEDYLARVAALGQGIAMTEPGRHD